MLSLRLVNHGYAVKEEALPPDWERWFVNLNDGTNEGIRHRYRPFRSVQFHPEAAAGPRDTAYLFDDFLRMVGEMRGVRNHGWGNHGGTRRAAGQT